MGRGFTNTILYSRWRRWTWWYETIVIRMISIFHPFVPFSLRPLIPFDRCRMRKEIKRGEEGRRRRRRKKTLNDTWKRKSWYGMRARLPGIRLGCRRYIGLLMTRVSCDSWNVLFCLENMVFLVLVSVSVELGGGYLRIFPLYSEKYNGGIGRWNYCRVRWRSVFRYVID